MIDQDDNPKDVIPAEAGTQAALRSSAGNAPTHGLRSGDATAIVALARGWIGTPYHHQASVQGVGCDCLGLVRGVYRQYTGRDPETPPPYSRDWAEASGIEAMLAAAGRHLVPVAAWCAPANEANGLTSPSPLRGGPGWGASLAADALRSSAPIPLPGHVLIFRLRAGLAAKHAAILATPATMIHAIEGAPTAEVAFSPWWRRRLAAVFAFPEGAAVGSRQIGRRQELPDLPGV